jgi:hypothetical protein
MEEEKLKKLFSELAEKTTESVRPGLCDDIKEQIPHRLIPHRKGMDTINIIVDLRISKLTAAAAIIITLILCANFLGVRASTGGGIFNDGVLMMRYFLTGARVSESDLSAARLKYEQLVNQDREAVYYGEGIDRYDSNAVVLHWKVSEGEYRVMFADTREKTVSSEELIKLQAEMLQKKRK